MEKITDNNMQKATPRHIAVTVGILFYMMFTGGIFMNIASTFFAAVAADTTNNIDIATLSAVSLPRNLVLTFLMPTAAALLKKHAKWTIAIGGVIITLPFFFQGFFTQGWQFMISGVILGVGGAVVNYSALPTIINRWWNIGTGTLIGLGGALSSLGKAVFTPVIAAMIQNMGWQQAYKITGLAGAIITFIAVIVLVRDDPSECNLKPVGAYIDESKAPHTKEAEEKAVPMGLDSSYILKTPTYYLSFLFALCSTIIMTFSSHLIYYSVQNGFTMVQGAAVVSTGAVAAYFTRLLIGILNDKYGVRIARWFADLLNILAVVFLLIANNTGSYLMLQIGGIFFGGGFCSATVCPMQSRAFFGTRDFAKANSYVQMGNSLGGALGVMFFGYMYKWTGSYTTSFYVMIGLVVVMVISGELAQITAKPLRDKWTA